MVDGFIIPQLMKLLRRSENNVNLLLEYLENTEKQKELDYSQYIKEIVLNIFSYENEALKEKQLKAAELMLLKVNNENRVQTITDI